LRTVAEAGSSCLNEAVAKAVDVLLELPQREIIGFL
jgi:hypothetical protein